MRGEVIEYYCRVKDSKMRLFLKHWWVGTYPLTYSPQDCLEAFCEMAGWEFVMCTGGNDLGPEYTFRCKTHSPRNTMDLIYVWYNYHMDRVMAGTA